MSCECKDEFISAIVTSDTDRLSQPLCLVFELDKVAFHDGCGEDVTLLIQTPQGCD